MFQSNTVFDDDNSKDRGRRSMAILKNSIVEKGGKDASFKLKKTDFLKFNQRYEGNSGCCSNSQSCFSNKPYYNI
jgi:hypothetical protein